jgi:pyruvate-formate lyase
VNELSYLMLEVMGEIHHLQPQGNIQLSRRSEDRFLRAAMKVVAKGCGYPSLFNADGIVEQIFAAEMPSVFLSVLIDDCIAKGLGYNAGGARYNTSYIQCVGIGTIAHSLSAIRTHVFEAGSFSMDRLLAALDRDFEGSEDLRARLARQSVFMMLFDTIDGRPNSRGGAYHVNMLPTTCHICFGSVTGASADGRRAGAPLSEGISPVQGADRKGAHRGDQVGIEDGPAADGRDAAEHESAAEPVREGGGSRGARGPRAELLPHGRAPCAVQCGGPRDPALGAAES